MPVDVVACVDIGWINISCMNDARLVWNLQNLRKSFRQRIWLDIWILRSPIFDEGSNDLENWLSAREFLHIFVKNLSCFFDVVVTLNVERQKVVISFYRSRHK